ncbi:hypothetical protein MPLSOD_140222 [Mesorhizobium sp. SOD10]|nr:hypothetical protein MPLSOD_140222 [Mesorhizobium sp. SOD10]
MAVQMLWGSCEAWPAFLRVASKGVYAGGGSIAEGSLRRKPLNRKPWRRQVPYPRHVASGSSRSSYNRHSKDLWRST